MENFELTYEEHLAEERELEKSISDSNKAFQRALSDLQDENERCQTANETLPTYRDGYRLVSADGTILFKEVDIETVLRLKEENPELSWGF